MYSRKKYSGHKLIQEVQIVCYDILTLITVKERERLFSLHPLRFTRPDWIKVLRNLV